MQGKFKVGSTYIAKGFSNYGSVIRVKVLARSEQTARVGCDILFKESALRRIRLDEDGNETLNLSRGFSVSAADIDKEYSSLHEAQELQDEILYEQPASGRWDEIQELVIEETDEGVRFMNYTRHQAAPGNMYGEEWSPCDLEAEDQWGMVRIEDMVWENAPSNYPTSIVVNIPMSVVNTPEEEGAIHNAVMEAMKQKGYFYYYDHEAVLVSYRIVDVPTGNDFDPIRDTELGFNGGY